MDNQHSPTASSPIPMENNRRMRTYLLISGPSYKGMSFGQREAVREGIRTRLEEQGVRFIEYCWVWDDADRCLLLVGTYDSLEQATQWIKALESMGFDLCTRTHLPGDRIDGCGSH